MTRTKHASWARFIVITGLSTGKFVSGIGHMRPLSERK